MTQESSQAYFWIYSRPPERKFSSRRGRKNIFETQLGNAHANDFLFFSSKCLRQPFASSSAFGNIFVGFRRANLIVDDSLLRKRTDLLLCARSNHYFIDQLRFLDSRPCKEYFIVLGRIRFREKRSHCFLLSASFPFSFFKEVSSLRHRGLISGSSQIFFALLRKPILMHT